MKSMQRLRMNYIIKHCYNMIINFDLVYHRHWKYRSVLNILESSDLSLSNQKYTFCSESGYKTCNITFEAWYLWVHVSRRTLYVQYLIVCLRSILLRCNILWNFSSSTLWNFQLNIICRKDNVICVHLHTGAKPVLGPNWIIPYICDHTDYTSIDGIWQFLFLIGRFIGYWPPLRLTKRVRSGGRLTILWWRSWRRTHRDGFGTVPSVGTLSTLSQVEHPIDQMLLMFGMKTASGQMTVVLVQILILLYSQS